MRSPSVGWRSLRINPRSDGRVRPGKWNLSAYDAAYLDLAWRKSLPLATADADLRRVAIAEGVNLL